MTYIILANGVPESAGESMFTHLLPTGVVLEAFPYVHNVSVGI